MTSPEPSSLHEYFAGRLPDRLREIDEAWQAVRESAWNEEAVRLLYRLAHSLSGAGATFGFPAVSEAARALEHRLQTAAKSRGAAPDATPAILESLLERLHQAAREPADTGSTGGTGS